ncbi:MAG: hypothetical protein U1E70_19090 [Acetobacteraceae bacterium]|nr:hypothetical protein [Pseudomonadota bacterium]
MTMRVRMAALAALQAACLGLALAAPSAQAASLCVGTISGSPLRPMAQPPMMALDHHIDSIANPTLAQRFMSGVQSSGIKVVDKDKGTTTLDLSFLVQGPPNGPRGGSYRDLSWMRSEQVPGQIRSSLEGAKVDVTIYARDVASRSLVWTGAISCTIRTDNVEALAEALGTAVGKAVGKSVPQHAL